MGRKGRTKQYLARLGERITESFLVSRGFRILEKNFRTPFGEIDLIAERDGYLVFVEVKTRTSARFGPPLASITATKKRHILKNCQFYLLSKDLCQSPCRIDTVGVMLDDEHVFRKLEHIKNAVEL